uniref:Uncharacterized protein n=1 Tax=Cannabis sativa TaxID=3483 RepID=A0A803QKQ4_CANSA
MALSNLKKSSPEQRAQKVARRSRQTLKPLLLRCRAMGKREVRMEEIDPTIVANKETPLEEKKPKTGGKPFRDYEPHFTRNLNRNIYVSPVWGKNEGGGSDGGVGFDVEGESEIRVEVAWVGGMMARGGENGED